MRRLRTGSSSPGLAKNMGALNREESAIPRIHKEYPMSLGVLNNLSAMYAENNLNNTNNSLRTPCCSSCLPVRRSTPAPTTQPDFHWSTASRPTRRPWPSRKPTQPGRRRPFAGRRWRSLASDKPAQPGRDAGYRSLERHPQRHSGCGRQSGISVDPVGSLRTSAPRPLITSRRSSAPAPTSTPATHRRRAPRSML